jgi:hypothetical protein
VPETEHPAPSAPAATPAQAAPTATPPRKRSGCLGCLTWILILFVVFALLIGLALSLFFRIPQRLGIIPNAAERHFVATPDREAAAALLAEARAQGLDTRGVSLYVFPYKEGGGSAAIAMFDARKGFSFGQGGRLNPLGAAFSQIAGGPTAERLGIERVTVVYVSGKGQDLMTLSAARDSALSFANGSMSEEQFMSVLDGDIHLPAVLDEQIESFQKMTQ